MNRPGHQQHRSRRIVLAIVTSIISKGGNILLMLIAIPLAYRVLGEERAAIYGVMQSLMWLVSMADLGTGPGMSVVSQGPWRLTTASVRVPSSPPRSS